MKILSIDVGIKNLAFCLFEKAQDSSHFNITKWDVVNISEEETSTCCHVENNNNIEDEPLPPSTALIEELFKENMTSKGEETEPASTTFNKKPIIFDMSSRKVLPY